MRAIRFSRVVEIVLAQKSRAFAISALGSLARAVPSSDRLYISLAAVRAALGDKIADQLDSKHAREIVYPKMVQRYAWEWFAKISER
jgi:hypothetical protein